MVVSNLYFNTFELFEAIKTVAIRFNGLSLFLLLFFFLFLAFRLSLFWISLISFNFTFFSKFLFWSITLTSHICISLIWSSCNYVRYTFSLSFLFKKIFESFFGFKFLLSLNFVSLNSVTFCYFLIVFRRITQFPIFSIFFLWVLRETRF